jgi:hypothetical protein
VKLVPVTLRPVMSEAVRGWLSDYVAKFAELARVLDDPERVRFFARLDGMTTEIDIEIRIDRGTPGV